jgi:hypothetical protein
MSLSVFIESVGKDADVRQASTWTRWLILVIVPCFVGCRTERTTYLGWRPFASPKGSSSVQAKGFAAHASKRTEADALSDLIIDEPPPRSLTPTPDTVTETFEDHAVDRFDPEPIDPLSPAAQIKPGPMPKGYRARMNEFEQLGAKLSDSIPTSKRRFQFDTVYNPRRAETIHTEAGHILVTSAFLERVETRHQLAAALALEMAEVLREDEKVAQKQGLASAGVPAPAVNQNVSATLPTEEELQATASKILARAGFDRLDIDAVSRDLKGLLVDAAHSTAKLPTTGEISTEADPRGKEPTWSGPRPSLAN